MIRCSICIATHDKPEYLARILPAILRSSKGLDPEIIIVDDASQTDETRRVCEEYPVKYARINREPGYRNPSAARNVAYKMARGEIIVAMSDDVEPRGCAIETLVESIRPGEFLLATIYNRDWRGKPKWLYDRYHELVGPNWKRPLFFLGVLWRRDLYAIGGNDERFIAPGREDVWFADCLINHLGLIPRWLPAADAVGWHFDHLRPPDLARLTRPSNDLYRQLVAEARAGRIPWTSGDAPWDYTP